MPSFRADLETKGSVTGNSSVLCGDTSIVINRDIPSNINTTTNNTNDDDGDNDDDSISQELPRLNQSSWIEFCDQIDDALLPMAKIRKRYARISCSLTALALILVGTVPIILSRPSLRLTNSDGERGKYGYVQVIVMTMLLVPFFGTCCLVSAAKKIDSKLCNDLHYICREASDRNPTGVDFFFRHEIVLPANASRLRTIKYIEVRVGAASDDDGNNGRRPATPDTIVSHEESHDEETQNRHDLEQGGYNY